MGEESAKWVETNAMKSSGEIFSKRRKTYEEKSDQDNELYILSISTLRQSHTWDIFLQRPKLFFFPSFRMS